jgi:hypothetical protein
LLILLGAFLGAAAFSLKVVHFKNQLTLGELITFSSTIILAFLVSIKWRTNQFAKETAKEIILTLSNDFKKIISELSSRAESIAASTIWDEEKFAQILSDFRSARVTIGEISKISTVISQQNYCTNLIGEVEALKMLVTRRTPRTPRRIADVISIRTSANKIRQALVDLQFEILKTE